MQSLTPTTSQAFSRRSSQLSRVDQAVLAKTKQAKSILRLFLLNELTFDELKLTWNKLQVELDQLGYVLHLLREEGELCLEVQKADLRPLQPDLRFCFACSEVAVNCFCDRWWCDNCLGGFLKEVF